MGGLAGALGLGCFWREGGVGNCASHNTWGMGTWGWAMSMGAGRVGLDLFAVLKGGVDREIAALSLDVRVIGLPCPIRRANRTVE